MTPKQRFVVLCQFFLNGYNPLPYNYPACLDCILAFPDALVPDSPSLRHLAHRVVQEIAKMEGNQQYIPNPSSVGEFTGEIAVWLTNYFRDYVPSK